MVDDPLVFVLSLAELDNMKAWQYIRSMLNGSHFVEAERQRLTESVQGEQDSTEPTTLMGKLMVYIDIQYVLCLSTTVWFTLDLGCQCIT